MGHRRWSRRRSELKARAAAASVRRGTINLDERAAKWNEQNGEAALGMGKLEWNRIRRVIGLSPWGEQVLLRLKWHALSLYDAKHGKTGYPHGQCVHRHDVTLQHVFWDYAAASSLRRHFLHAWRRLGLRDTGLGRAIFSLNLPELPPGIWTVVDEARTISLGPPLRLAEAVTAIMGDCWRLGAAIYFQSV